MSDCSLNALEQAGVRRAKARQAEGGYHYSENRNDRVRFRGSGADEGLLGGWGGRVVVVHDEHVGGVRSERD